MRRGGVGVVERPRGLDALLDLVAQVVQQLDLGREEVEHLVLRVAREAEAQGQVTLRSTSRRRS